MKTVFSSSSFGSVRLRELMKFLKMYRDWTESKATVCSDMLRSLRKQEMKEIDSIILQQLGFKDPAVRLQVVAGIRSCITNKPRLRALYFVIISYKVLVSMFYLVANV